MTDLTKIEKPYGLCTKEQQGGLDALKTFPRALQCFHSDSVWRTLTFTNSVSFSPSIAYRQNPDWQPPKLDVPDWFWENTDYNYVAIDKNKEVYAYKVEPFVSTCDASTSAWDVYGDLYRLDDLFTYNFNPHNIPWDKSLTVRPGLDK